MTEKQEALFDTVQQTGQIDPRNHSLPKITIYCDGASKGNPGPGGWGAVIECFEDEWTNEICGGDKSVTNNQMELLAAIKALESLTIKSSVQVFTDSQYVCKGMNEWIAGWKRKGWISSTKEPVKNKDLWVRLDLICSKHQVKWNWVKGHAGHPGNERADALANMGVPR